MKSDGVTSAALFQSPSNRPYVLCTTSPSNERERNGGEWSYISPVADFPAIVPPELDQNLIALRKAPAIVMGAASPHGDIVALLEQTGKLWLFPTMEIKHGGYPSWEESTILEKRLCEQRRPSNTCLRFHFRQDENRLCLYAVDVKGKVIKKSFDERRSAPLGPEVDGFIPHRLSL